MEQTVKNMETKARIKGLPVYRLRGVTAENESVVINTGMWARFPRLDDGGWCLAVPDPMREGAMTALGHNGITLEDMSELPKPDRSLQVAYFVAVAVAFPIMFKMNFFLAWIALIILLNIGNWWWQNTTQAHYAEVLRPVCKQNEDDDFVSEAPCLAKASAGIYPDAALFPHARDR